MCCDLRLETCGNQERSLASRGRSKLSFRLLSPLVGLLMTHIKPCFKSVGQIPPAMGRLVGHWLRLQMAYSFPQLLLTKYLKASKLDVSIDLILSDKNPSSQSRWIFGNFL